VSALAGCYQAVGDHERTISQMRHALILAERLGLSYFAAFARVNLALSEAARGMYEAALGHVLAVEAIEGALKSIDTRGVLAYVRAEIAAATGTPDEADDRLRGAACVQRESQHLVPDFARCIERALARAHERGLEPLARSLLAEALRLWELLGGEAEAMRLRSEWQSRLDLQ